MKMRKLRLLTIGLAMVTLSVSAGCGSGGTGQASDTQSSDATDGGASCAPDGNSNDLGCGSDAVVEVSNPPSCAGVPDGTTCDDGDPCTELDACTGGVCQGITKSCGDGNPCTNDSCNPKTGTCVHVPSDAMCDDGNACTTGDKCANGACVPGASLNCDDTNACTTDSCDKTMGCVHAAIDCNDNNPCTNDMCDPKSGCAHTPLANGAAGEDGNACTTDTCAPATGCQHAALSGAVCDDGNPNTIGDTCQAGVCVGAAPSCDDKNPCTVDSGDPATGVDCTHTPVVCDDGNPCTTEACDSKKGCVSVNNGALCDDGNACTVGDVCKNGSCASGVALDCDDNNPCTLDACDMAKGCTYVVLEGVACNDGNACTTNDKCNAAAVCVGGPAPNCDDGNVCTTDSCSLLAGGCTHIALSGTMCDDQNPGTVNDTCQVGTCKGSSLACDDGNACTLDGGNPGSCTHVAITCDDNNLCTTDTCDPKVGCTFNNNTEPCDDGNVCTSGDTCGGGVCIAGGITPSCDDKNPCTTDACDPKSGACTHTAIAGCVVPAEVCGDGIDNDGNGLTDCDDSECGASATAFVLYVAAQYDGAVVDFVTANKPSQVQTFPVPTTGKAYLLKCAEVPFSATLSTSSQFDGTLQAWVQGSSGATPDEKVASAPQFWAFDVWWPLPPKGPAVVTKSFAKSSGEAFKVAWPALK